MRLALGQHVVDHAEPTALSPAIWREAQLPHAAETRHYVTSHRIAGKRIDEVGPILR